MAILNQGVLPNMQIGMMNFSKSCYCRRTKDEGMRGVEEVKGQSDSDSDCNYAI